VFAVPPSGRVRPVESQTGLIRRLQEARPQSAVHLNSGADNALSDPVQIFPFCHLCALGGKHLRRILCQADHWPGARQVLECHASSCCPGGGVVGQASRAGELRPLPAGYRRPEAGDPYLAAVASAIVGSADTARNEETKETIVKTQSEFSSRDEGRTLYPTCADLFDTGDGVWYNSLHTCANASQTIHRIVQGLSFGQVAVACACRRIPDARIDQGHC